MATKQLTYTAAQIDAAIELTGTLNLALGQLTGFVVLTQAEYDALPSSKLTDGVLYLIEEV